jgi:DNA-binding MarR family transcriptional regulator
VRKEPCPDDARGFDVVLTPQGLAAIKNAAPRHVDAVRHCFADVLTQKQLDALAEIAETVVRHIETRHVLGD